MARAEALECRRLLSTGGASLIGTSARPFGTVSPPVDVELAPPFPLIETFLLHSQPTASKTIYLDFDGHTTSGTAWNEMFTDDADFFTPAYTLDGNPDFSDEELERIQKIWQRVVEDFIPFDVDVTTEFPGLEALRNTGGGDSQWGVRIVIGGDGLWYSDEAGGVAFIGSFTLDSDTPGFVFSDIFFADKDVAEAISHEAGHTLGLVHDGRAAAEDEYYEGHGSGETGWAPIMGAGYYQNLTQWSKGEYADANNGEDDLHIITTQNGFGYRADDHGDTIATASPLGVDGINMFAGQGLIERNTDVDLFELLTDGGSFNLSIDPFDRGPNLDIRAELYDEFENLILASDPSERLGADLPLSLAPGTYYLKISGVGKASVSGTSYSDYGSLGYYSISTGSGVPENDDFANRIVLSGVYASATGTNLFATIESGEPMHEGTGGSSVWWSWTAPTSDEYAVSTAGSNFDTVLGVYTGTSVEVLSLVGSNDDHDLSLTSRVVFQTVAGTTYQIAVDGFAGDTGAISLAVALSTAHTIGGVAFGDDDADGVMDFEETVLAGVEFWLDLNNNTIRDLGEPTATSDANGSYAFNGLADGTYHVRQVGSAAYLRTTAAVLSTPVSSTGNFTVVDGAWGVVAGNYEVITPVNSNPPDLNTRTIHNTVISGDFFLAVLASVQSGQSGSFNDFGIIFGYQNPQNYYFFSSNQTNDALTSGIFKVVGGAMTQIADVTTTIAAGVTFNVVLERNGDSIFAYRNGDLLASAVDTTFMSGRIGLGAKSNRARFDDLAVWDSGGLAFFEDFSTGSVVTGMNFGSFPLIYNGGQGQDAFQLVTSGDNLVHEIIHNVNGGVAKSYSIAKALLGSNPLTFLGSGAGDTITVDYVNGQPVPVAGIVVDSLALEVLGSPAADNISIFAGGFFDLGPNSIRLQGNIAGATVNAGGGNDLVNIGFDLVESGAVIGVDGGSGYDQLSIDTSLPVQVTASTVDDSFPSVIISYGGIEALSVSSNGGTITEDLDGLDVNIGFDFGEILVNQHLNRLIISGFDILVGLDDGNDVFVTCTELLFGQFGQLGISGNSGVIVNNSGASPLGSWNGSAYTGLLGTVQLGAIVRDHEPLNVGIAEASAALGISGGQTALWRGQLVHATSILIGGMPGDADLSGVIDADDYFQIDSHYGKTANSAKSYFNGDFDYDGDIDGDDYYIIDAAFSAQFAPASLAHAWTGRLSTDAGEFIRPIIHEHFESAYERLNEDEAAA